MVVWPLLPKRLQTVRRFRPPLKRPLDALRVRWLAPGVADAWLSRIHADWHEALGRDDLAALCDVRMRVWAARRGLEPMPRIAVAETSVCPVGVACAHRAPMHRCVRIEQWAVHPALGPQDVDTVRVLEALLEWMELWSLELGWYGRVMAPCEIVPPTLRPRLGFLLQDPWTLLRAGALYGG